MNPLLKSPKPRHGDRFIPTRAGNTWDDYPISPCLPSASIMSTPPLKQFNRRSVRPEKTSRLEIPAENTDTGLYSNLVRNEVLNFQMSDYVEKTPEKKLTPKRKLFHFDASERSPHLNPTWSQYSTSPISSATEEFLVRSMKKPVRRIAKSPYKVLDAPDLQDDFYLNLVDWSSQNSVGVGLGSCVYLWSATTLQVFRLCDLALTHDSVTSVCWNQKGNFVAVGTNNGFTEIWDAEAKKKVTTVQGHSYRVGTVAWNGDVISSGSRDKMIVQKDIRTPASIKERVLIAHRQEVCGLKWSPDQQYLASGGNDNRLCIWNMHSTAPVQTYEEHTAAVKAIDWSPHQHGILATGGGTADKCIRIWNIVTAQPMQSIETGSQVCNLAWSKHSSEFVSTHGYSKYQIFVWKYPSLQKVAELQGHTQRVLYLSVSPDGESIVTGAGDETLRFWNVFKKNKSQKENQSSLTLHKLR